ncbi:hypothetical protein Y032_0269g811 [Ancylostoma ceylanicum]|uniref:Uncharacterized protein n=1 Tax=Ancylostoma ceylanicum TaxID=53326 RepID=A0A016S8Q7_9BILA|nr:hypothetical protein Y032_0269g811 [Ancylostoma ceylanicum]
MGKGASRRGKILRAEVRSRSFLCKRRERYAAMRYNGVVRRAWGTSQTITYFERGASQVTERFGQVGGQEESSNHARVYRLQYAGAARRGLVSRRGSAGGDTTHIAYLVRRDEKIRHI